MATGACINTSFASNNNIKLWQLVKQVDVLMITLTIKGVWQLLCWTNECIRWFTPSSNNASLQCPCNKITSFKKYLVQVVFNELLLRNVGKVKYSTLEWIVIAPIVHWNQYCRNITPYLEEAEKWFLQS
jgi:hypothetical protein